MANESGQRGYDERSKDDRFEHQLSENDEALRLGRNIVGGAREAEAEARRTFSVDDPTAMPLNPSSIHNSSIVSNGEPLAFSTYLGASNGSLPWTDGGIPSLYDGGDLTDLEPFGPEYGWSFPPNQTPSLEAQIPVTSSLREDCQLQSMGLDENNTTTAYSRRSNAQTSKLPRVAIGPAISNRTLRSFDSSTSLDSQVGARDSEMEASINFGIFTPRSVSQEDFAEKGGLSFESSFSVDKVQHQRMQELSELGMNLYSQLTANGAQLQGTTGSPALQDQFVGNIIKSSASFLALLSSFYPRTPPSTRDSVFTSSDEDRSASKASEFGYFTTDEISQRRHPKRSVANSVGKDDLNPLPADMTTIFQLLTCYIQIIHLHSILYSRISDYLTAQARRDTLLPPIFPGMQVGGLLLDDFGNFQVKLLLQISTHILGEIEMMLGLPDGYRISKKSTQCQGILETSVSVQFIKMMMSENGQTGLGIERDRVMSIRDNLVSLRRLLKGTINI